MSKFILVLFVSVFSFGILSSQSIEEEIEFKYIKAKYLLDTERYEDAIKAFTEIIELDESYSDAMILRAKSKYAMAAYRGTKKDVLLFAVNNGFTEDALVLLGKADYKMGNSDAAINSLSMASKVVKDDAQVDEFLGNLYEKNDMLEEACIAWRRAAKNGSSKASINATKNCGDFEEAPKKKKTKVNKPKMDSSTLPTKSKVDTDATEDRIDDVNKEVEDARTEDEKRRDEDDSINNPRKESDTETEDTDEDGSEVSDQEDDVDVVSDSMPVEDDTPNELVVDEDLTLIIKGQGLGKRKILDQPNILMISDEKVTVTVAIDICVNKRGKVESAEFNSKLSTIAKKSLVSLAIRKSKDFWFEKNDFKEQCGVILFEIKGI